jgi:membrane fusion protein (multidrug efflux system)
MSQNLTTRVVVQRVRAHSVALEREYVGHVEAMEQVEIRAKVQGYLEEVRFREGSLVKAGELLYRIEDASFKADVEVAEARVEQAKAELFRASQYLQRLKEVKAGAVSQLDMDKAIADELKAKADLRLREAELKNARINLGYTEIKAPISGRIGQSSFKKGDLVGPSSGALAKIVSVDPVRIVFSPSERELPRLLSDQGRPRFLARVPGPGGSGMEIPCELDFMDNKVDPKTGTIAVWLRAKNPKGLRVQGQYVRVIWQEKAAGEGLVVPQRAILQDQKGRYVLVVEGGIVKERRIKVGQMLKDGWVVEEGLGPGEMVVVEGIQKVRPGQPVETEEIQEGPAR